MKIIVKNGFLVLHMKEQLKILRLTSKNRNSFFVPKIPSLVEHLIYFMSSSHDGLSLCDYQPL